MAIIMLYVRLWGFKWAKEAYDKVPEYGSLLYKNTRFPAEGYDEIDSFGVIFQVYTSWESI